MTLSQPAPRTLVPRSGCADPVRPAVPDRRPPTVALVGRIDRRAITAVEVAGARGEVRALHVMEPGEDHGLVAERWSQGAHRAVPIELLDRKGTIADTIVARLIEARRDGDFPVAIVVCALHLPHWWQRGLHDRSARDIERRIASALGVEVDVARVTLPT